MATISFAALACQGEAKDEGSPAARASGEVTAKPTLAPVSTPAGFEMQLYEVGTELDALPLTVGIETLGGVASPLLPKGCALPCERAEVFSTAVDSQPSVEIYVLVGEAKLAAQAHGAARIQLGELLPAPAGVPQIEVRFRVDARGMLTVTAQDLATSSPRPVKKTGPVAEPLNLEDIARLAHPSVPDLSTLDPDTIASVPMFDAGVAAQRLPLTISVETLGAVASPLLARGVALPAHYSEVFTTAVDNQASVEVHLVQGERPRVADNRTLGKFSLVGIPPAPRGVPQIEVTLIVDASGVLSASALDLGTKRQQKIEIQGGPQTGLSQADIDRMLADATAHAAEDTDFRARTELLTELDSLSRGSSRTLNDRGVPLRPTTREALETALTEASRLLLLGADATDLAALEQARDQLESAAHQASRELHQR